MTSHSHVVVCLLNVSITSSDNDEHVRLGAQKFNYLYYYYVSTVGVHFARCTFCRSAHARGRTLRAATAAIPAAPPRIPSSAQPFQPAAECSPAPDSSVPSAGCVPPAAPRPARASLPAAKPASRGRIQRCPRPIPSRNYRSRKGFHPAAASSAAGGRFHRTPPRLLPRCRPRPAAARGRRRCCPHQRCRRLRRAAWGRGRRS